jgi:hypothetical protein
VMMNKKQPVPPDALCLVTALWTTKYKRLS